MKTETLADKLRKQIGYLYEAADRERNSVEMHEGKAEMIERICSSLSKILTEEAGELAVKAEVECRVKQMTIQDVCHRLSSMTLNDEYSCMVKIKNTMHWHNGPHAWVMIELDNEETMLERDACQMFRNAMLGLPDAFNMNKVSKPSPDTHVCVGKHGEIGTPLIEIRNGEFITYPL
jgi:hypothetical protein